MLERELQRRKQYEEMMKKRFYDYLEKQDLKMIRDNGYCFILEYKGQQFGLLSNRDWNSWNKHYQVWIIENRKTLATRCLLETAIAKAKTYIEEMI